jgi:hypothetical protein
LYAHFDFFCLFFFLVGIFQIVGFATFSNFP